MCLQPATACALLWRRKTEAFCAQQPAGRERSRGREHKSVLPGSTGVEGPQLQTLLNLLTFGGWRCGVRLGEAGICNHALQLRSSPQTDPSKTSPLSLKCGGSWGTCIQAPLGLAMLFQERMPLKQTRTSSFLKPLLLFPTPLLCWYCVIFLKRSS